MIFIVLWCLAGLTPAVLMTRRFIRRDSESDEIIWVFAAFYFLLLDLFWPAFLFGMLLVWFVKHVVCRGI